MGPSYCYGVIVSMIVSPKPWIVAATGPSLTPEVAEQCKGHNVIAVNDAYRLLPFARALYAADSGWWKLHKGCPGFAGDKWTTCGRDLEAWPAKDYGIQLIGSPKGAEGFSFTPGVIHRGANSGFQAVNLALVVYGATSIVLVGFDMHGSHFFGEHPPMPRRSRGSSSGKAYARFMRNFSRAAELLPSDRKIINATPGSAMTCFPMMPLEEALAHA